MLGGCVWSSDKFLNSTVDVKKKKKSIVSSLMHFSNENFQLLAAVFSSS